MVEINRKKITIIVLTVFLLLSLVILSFNPIVIDNVIKKRTDNLVQKGDIIQPLNKFDFNEGVWKAYIVNGSDDSSSELCGSKVLKTKDIFLMKELNESWVFKYSGNDVATVNSKFFLYKDNVLMFTSSIVVDKTNSGLQDINYGWLQSEDNMKFYNLINEFERSYFPLHIFSN